MKCQSNLKCGKDAICLTNENRPFCDDCKRLAEAIFPGKIKFFQAIKIRVTNPGSSFVGDYFYARRVGNIGYKTVIGMSFTLNEAETVPNYLPR